LRSIIEFDTVIGYRVLNSSTSRAYPQLELKQETQQSLW